MGFLVYDYSTAREAQTDVLYQWGDGSFDSGVFSALTFSVKKLKS